jgi:hypothetical protein
LASGTVNEYVYVFNRYTSTTDPSGRAPIVVIGALAASLIVCLEFAGLGWPKSQYFDDPNDRFKHCYFACCLSRGPCGGILTQIIGLGKEAIDELCALLGNPGWPCGDPSNRGFDSGDIEANQYGTSCASWISYLPIPCIGLLSYFWNGSCYDCCNEKYHQGKNA